MNYFQDLRLHWIIETIRIYGFINRHHVEQKFGISTPQASKDLQLACKLDNRIIYNKNAKRYEYKA